MHSEGDLSEQFTFQLAMKRPSDQVNREERPLSKRQQTAPELFDISSILKKKGDLEFYKERFFSWRRINNRDPNQPIAAQRDSWRTFVRLENENKMERLLRRGNARAQRRTPADDRANPSSGRRSVAPGDATSGSRSCGPRREHQTPSSDVVPTCPSSVDIHATELCRSVEDSTASSHESVDPHDQQSTQPPSDDLPESLSMGVGLNAKTIERLWKWKSAHHAQIETLEVRDAILSDRCESLEDQVKEQESRIDSLTFGPAQYRALESRFEQRFEQVQGELERLQKAEKAREMHHERLLRSVEEAGTALEVLRKEYNSRLLVLEAVKEESFDVLQRLYAEKKARQSFVKYQFIGIQMEVTCNRSKKDLLAAGDSPKYPMSKELCLLILNLDVRHSDELALQREKEEEASEYVTEEYMEKVDLLSTKQMAATSQLEIIRMKHDNFLLKRQVKELTKTYDDLKYATSNLEETVK
ncbi:hypothetical protein FI667_g16930, partial [Globisporangium splendens]